MKIRFTEKILVGCYREGEFVWEITANWPKIGTKVDGPLDPLEIPTPEWPLEFPHYFFLVILGNFTLFLIKPCKFHMLFLWYPWKFHILNPPCLDFFWNSPTGHFDGSCCGYKMVSDAFPLLISNIASVGR